MFKRNRINVQLIFYENISSAQAEFPCILSVRLRIGPILRYESENSGSSKVRQILRIKAYECSLKFFWKKIANDGFFPRNFRNLLSSRIPVNNYLCHALKQRTKAIWMLKVNIRLIIIIAAHKEGQILLSACLSMWTTSHNIWRFEDLNPY